MPFKSIEDKRAYQRQWHQRRRTEFFVDKSCVRCGSTKDLELDHIDPSKKVSHRIWNWSAERRASELEKCQVLCKSCHKTKSKEDRPEIQHGGGIVGVHNCPCELCKKKKKEYDKARQFPRNWAN